MYFNPLNGYDCAMPHLTKIIESLLFVAQEPLTVERLKKILETVEPNEIRSSLIALAGQYETRDGGFGLYQVAEGWQLRSRPQYNPWIKRLLQPPPQRLTRASLETLAIVAYNQPIMRAEIEHIRGVDCGSVLRQLMERKLIRVLGRKEIPGRPLIYATTKLFLELFDLKNLQDLPSPKEIEALTAPQDNGLKPSALATGKEPLKKELKADLSLDEQSAKTDPPTAPGGSALHGDTISDQEKTDNASYPCRAAAKARPYPLMATVPTPISREPSKIGTRPTAIPNHKARPPRPAAPLSGQYQGSIKQGSK